MTYVKCMWNMYAYVKDSVTTCGSKCNLNCYSSRFTILSTLFSLNSFVATTILYIYTIYIYNLVLKFCLNLEFFFCIILIKIIFYWPKLHWISIMFFIHTFTHAILQRYIYIYITCNYIHICICTYKFRKNEIKNYASVQIQIYLTRL